MLAAVLGVADQALLVGIDDPIEQFQRDLADDDRHNLDGSHLTGSDLILAGTKDVFEVFDLRRHDDAAHRFGPHDQFLVIVSCRLRIVRATSVQAASSAGARPTGTGRSPTWRYDSASLTFAA